METEFFCELCPRRCHALRTPEGGSGFCGMGSLPKIARAMPHYGEEPCLSGLSGAGNVFFSGCSLGCVFCQNDLLSHEHFGETVTIPRLRRICEALAEECENVGFVTASHYIPVVEAVLEKPLGVPAVFNCGGYDRVDALRRLEGKIDVYLPDLKFCSPIAAQRYAHAPDYFETATAAILEMVRQVGPCVFDEDGMLRRGVLIRHLVLPGLSADSLRLLRWCRENLPDTVRYSIMSQYTPCGAARSIPALNRRVSPAEYRRVVAFLEENDMEGYCQELTSAGEEEIPDFRALEFFGESEDMP